MSRNQTDLGRTIGLALGFVNTAAQPSAPGDDRIATADDLRRWLSGVGLDREGPAAAMLSPATARIVHTEAHRLRSAARRLLDAHASGAAPSPDTLFALNRVLRDSPRVTALEPRRGTIVETEQHLGVAPIAILAPIALAVVELVTTVDAGRLRVCDAPTCGTWFVDTSKGGRRRWCSMTTCGNRAKAARHRRRGARRPSA